MDVQNLSETLTELLAMTDSELNLSTSLVNFFG